MVHLCCVSFLERSAFLCRCLKLIRAYSLETMNFQEKPERIAKIAGESTTPPHLSQEAPLLRRTLITTASISVTEI